MCEYEQRNLEIIEAVMLELGVSDIEELPAKVHQLVGSRRTPLALDGATCAACKSSSVVPAVYCLQCGFALPPRQ
jgi:hypothetical protein